MSAEHGGSVFPPHSSSCPPSEEENDLDLLGNAWCTHMGGISQDVKRLKVWDFYTLFFGFSLPFIFELL